MTSHESFKGTSSSTAGPDSLWCHGWLYMNMSFKCRMFFASGLWTVLVDGMITNFNGTFWWSNCKFVYLHEGYFCEDIYV
jgi:hypothetical protein